MNKNQKHYKKAKKAKTQVLAVGFEMLKDTCARTYLARKLSVHVRFKYSKQEWVDRHIFFKFVPERIANGNMENIKIEKF